MWPKIHIIRIPEREERDGNIEKVFEEMMVENLPNMMKTIKTRLQWTSITKNMRKFIPSHIIINFSKPVIKKKILKSHRKKDTSNTEEQT